MRRTDSRIVAVSIGLIVLRSTTSTETPSSASRPVASRAEWTMFDQATTVMSVPSRLTSATPIGTTAPGRAGSPLRA